MTEFHRLLPDRPVRTLRDHQARGGGRGIAAAREMDPDALISMVAASGLRGRGGAGFPTGVKWRTVAEFASPTQPTPVVVNAAEGEPGTFKDRLLLRRDPFLVLEGALVAARALASPRIVVATKAAFTIEIAALHDAIDELRRAGWCDGVGIEVVVGPSEYLFGEETGLLEVLEGRPPFPRVTPPWRRGFDSSHPENAHSAAGVQLATPDGDDAAPALVDNVETLADVALIADHGPAWFREVGTASSPGTVLCTVTGATRRHGVGEFALGTPVGEVIEALGGGPREDRTIRAVLSGVSNPPLPADRFDTPLTYEDMTAAGSGLGSASFVVIDDSASARWVAARVARFLSVESCGQCEPCKRDGLAIAADLAPDGAGPFAVGDRLATVARGARCALARQTQSVVGAVLALAGGTGDPSTDVPAAEDADLMEIVPLVDIIDSVALLDLSHRAKAFDWTYPDEVPARPIWPIQRLADQPVTIDPPHVRERRQHSPITVDALDPMTVVNVLDDRLRDAMDRLERASAGERDAARRALVEELHRHLDLLERIVYPLLERAREDGADVARYPDEHARRALGLLGVAHRREDDRAALAHARRAVDEVQLRVVPMLRDQLDEPRRRLVSSALALEGGLLGIEASPPRAAQEVR